MDRSILVVDDNAALRKGVMTLLRMHRHGVRAAETVAEARSQLDAAKPSHLLLDLNLPDGVGTDLLRRIRAEQLPIRVALLTATADAAILDEARALGVDAVFIKPPDWDELLKWIAQP